MRHRDYITAAVLVAIASALVLGRQFVEPGVYCCMREDTIYYINWTRQFADALASGVIYPRWMADSHNGYGNPTFIFYPPLVIYITAVLKLATGDIGLSVTLVKLAGLLLSGFFMYVFMSGLSGHRAGIVSALVYMLLPFRVFDQYFIGVFPSKFAFVWFPLILHYARKSVAEPRIGRGTAFLAISYAMLCLTHLLSAYMFAFVFVSFGVIAAGKGRTAAGGARAALGGLFGLCLAGFFLLPVLVYGNLVHLESFGAKEWGRYWNNFLFYVGTSRSPYNPPFYGYLAGTVLWSAVAGAAVFLLGRNAAEKPGRRTTIFFVSAVILCLFLMSSLSAPVWRYVPGMSMVAFPTRWASVMVLCLACLSGTGHGGPLTMDKPRKRLLHAVFLGLAAVSLVMAARYDTEIISKGCRYTQSEVASFPRGMDVEEYVPRTVSLGWLRGMEDMPAGPHVFATNSKIPAKIDIMLWKSEERRFIVDTPESATFVIRTFSFPGWRVWLDGAEAGTGVQPVTGAMTLKVPAGRHGLVVRFKDTRIMTAGWLLSGLALIGMILLSARTAGKTRC